MRISDWSSDVCSSDLGVKGHIPGRLYLEPDHRLPEHLAPHRQALANRNRSGRQLLRQACRVQASPPIRRRPNASIDNPSLSGECRSEEHTSELQSLMRISYAVFCLKKKKTKT